MMRNKMLRGWSAAVAVAVAVCLLAATTGATTLTFTNDYVELGVDNYGSFGLSTTGGLPDDPNDDGKRLTYGGASSAGSTGGFSVKVDDTLYQLHGTTPSNGPTAIQGVDGATVSWLIHDNGDDIEVDVRYELVDNGSGRADTVKVTITILHLGGAVPPRGTRTIGVKLGYDTEIGSNDGVPVRTAAGIIPVETGFGAGFADPVPDFWQALEVNDLANPGVVAQGTFSGGAATKPDKFVVGNFSDVSHSSTFDYVPDGSSYSNDSAVGMWWLNRSLAPESTLIFVTFYGLSDFTNVQQGNVSVNLAAPNQAPINGTSDGFLPFDVTATVQNDTGAPLVDASVQLTFPDGRLTLTNGTSPQTLTLPTGQTLVAWQAQPTIAAAGTTQTLQVDVTHDQLHLQATRDIDVPTIITNIAPVAADDRAVVRNDVTDYPIDVMLNDTDADHDPLSLSAVQSPTRAGGTAILPTRTAGIAYTPPTRFTGVDMFTYTVEDGKGGTATATVYVRVVAAPAAIAVWPPDNATDIRPDAVLEVSVVGGPVEMRTITGAVGRVGTNPDYDYLIGQRPITVEQYVEFLNDLVANPDYHVVFADGVGNLFGGIRGEASVQLFDISQTKQVFGAGGRDTAFDYRITYAAARNRPYQAAETARTFPVVGVTWFGAVAYCNWLSGLRGVPFLEPAYIVGSDLTDWRPATFAAYTDWTDGFSANERTAWIAAAPDAYRLPMDGEADGHDPFNEFLWAAIGDADPLVQPYGTPDGGNYWNSRDFFDNGPTPPAYYPPNANGLDDMSGNVWEWQTDRETATADRRAIRGGSWYNPPTGVDARFGLAPETAYSDVGFRVAANGADFTFRIELSTDRRFDAQYASVYRNYTTDPGSEMGSLARTWAPLDGADLQPSTRYYWRVQAYDYLTETWTPWTEASFSTSNQTRLQTPQQLTLDENWRLISLDRDPQEFHPKYLFGMNSTTWTWDAQQQRYELAFGLAAFQGAWATAGAGADRTVVEVDGFTPLDYAVHCYPGWNLAGPAVDAPRPTARQLRGPIVGYDPIRHRYVPLGADADWLSGSGYWLFSVGDFVLPLPPPRNE